MPMKAANSIVVRGQYLPGELNEASESYKVLLDGKPLDAKLG